MIHDLTAKRKQRSGRKSQAGAILCEHRKVSNDGRIVCAKIVAGENRVTPNECRRCPFRRVNCAHLRFSLEQTSPNPIIVRFNGRQEIWDNGPPELRFAQAACAVKVMPVEHPADCARCALRRPLSTPATAQTPPVAEGAKIVPFPLRRAAAG